MALSSPPIKPILRYPGSKWRMATWIASMLPPHDVYLEPYFGSGAVFFTKEPSRVEVINDLSGNVVTFFKVLRERPDDLARAIELTPYSRAEFDLAHRNDGADDLERARLFFARCWMSYGGKLGSRSGWRSVWDGSSGPGKRTAKISAVSLWRGLPPRIALAAARLTDAIIENRPAIAAIRQYGGPSTVLYVDPPYLQDVVLANRKAPKSWARYYEHEISDSDHRELLEVLKSYCGPVLLSGYRSDLYDDQLADWTRMDRGERSALGSARVECLWLNPTAAATVRQPELAGMNAS